MTLRFLGLRILILRRRQPVQAPALDEEQLQRALGSLRDEDPRWLAIVQILNENIASAIDRASDKRAADLHGTLAHLAGGVCWLLDFRDQLVAERARALRAAAAEQKQR